MHHGARQDPSGCYLLLRQLEEEAGVGLSLVGSHLLQGQDRRQGPTQICTSKQWAWVADTSPG